jgi:predicted DNA-binding transcriptional regulator AlpA
MSELLGIEQLAELLGTSVNTVRYWRTIGYGPKSARIGRRVAYRRTEVLVWIDNQFGDSRTPAGAA